jgi:hypothetical protein
MEKYPLMTAITKVAMKILIGGAVLAVIIFGTVFFIWLVETIPYMKEGLAVVVSAAGILGFMCVIGNWFTS